MKLRYWNIKFLGAINGAISSLSSAGWGYTVRMEPFGLAKSSEDMKTCELASYDTTRV